MPGESILLDGSRSADFEEDALIFEWAVSDPDGIVSSYSGKTAYVLADKPGRYKATLVVNDGELNSAPDTAIFSTEPLRPVARAGYDFALGVGEEVQLDGRVSSDFDLQFVGFNWSLLHQPADAEAKLHGERSSRPTFVAKKKGLYLLQLVVDDGQYVSAPDTIVINVKDNHASGIPALVHALILTHPKFGSDDSDADGVLDPLDNCLYKSNASQIDSNGDGIGNLVIQTLTTMAT